MHHRSADESSYHAHHFRDMTKPQLLELDAEIASLEKMAARKLFAAQQRGARYPPPKIPCRCGKHVRSHHPSRRKRGSG